MHKILPTETKEYSRDRLLMKDYYNVETMKDGVSLTLKRKREDEADVQFIGLNEDQSYESEAASIALLENGNADTTIQRVDSYSSLLISLADRDKNFASSSHSSFSPSNLTDLPQELLLTMISFLGPRCSSLLRLSETNKTFRSILQKVGDAMIVKASSSFRRVLPRLHPMESDISLFIRHARCCKDIEYKCLQLKQILDKDFIVGCCLGPIIVRPISIGKDCNRPVRRKEAVTIQEIDTALAIALELIGQDSLSYFMSSGKIKVRDIDPNLLYSERGLLTEHCSRDIEKQILSLVGRCGGKVFKFMKLRKITRINWSMHESIDNNKVDFVDMDRTTRARLLMRLVFWRNVKQHEI